MGNIYSKLAKARAMFYEQKIKKSGKNAYAGYDYFELSDILPSCIRICNEVGLAPIISFEEGYAVMTVYDGESDSSFQIRSPLADATLKGCHPIQNLGAVETYSRRYLWFSLFEITESDPLETTTGREDEDEAPKASAPAKKQNRNDDKVPSAGVAAASLWGAVCKSYGWSNDLSDADKEDVKKSAHEFFESFGVRDVSKDWITEETKEKIVKELSKRADGAA